MPTDGGHGPYRPATPRYPATPGAIWQRQEGTIWQRQAPSGNATCDLDIADAPYDA